MSTAEARAGWVQPKNAWYVKVWERTLAGQSVYGTGGEKAELPDSYGDHALNVYAEYGATDDVTVVLRATPLGFASIGDASTMYSGVSYLGLRIGLLRDAVPLALELSYGYSPPLDDEPLAGGTVAGMPFVLRPSIEQHLARAELSAGWAVGPLWSRARAAAIFSSGTDIDPAVEVGLSIGGSTSFGLAASISTVFHAPASTPRIIDVTGTGNTRYLGLELTLAWWLTDHVAIDAGIGTAPTAASNAATPSLSFGVEIRS